MDTLRPIRVRIAPSPTGFLHIGTARTALFNYLYAKHVGGVFVLRIEDTDVERSEKRFEQTIFDGLAWLGIKPDEGPNEGGPYGPYRQSERLPSYKDALKRLLDAGNAYYCFHTIAELDRERDELMAMKRPVIHVCEFREMARTDAEVLAEANPNHIIRFKTPHGRVIAFHDQIKGALSFQSDLIGDFSIAKNLDTPLYNFAVVVDDATMDITHVIRGEDHISNTPKQLLIFEALGAIAPVYGHLPLILGSDRSKMSKRHGATSIDEYRRDYLPQALFNFIALLGWNPGTPQEIFSHDELIAIFDITKVQKSGAIFDQTKLDWMNGEYIRAQTPLEFKESLSLSSIKSIGGFHDNVMERFSGLTDDTSGGISALEQPRLKRLSDFPERIDYFVEQPTYQAELLQWKQMTNDEIITALRQSYELVESCEIRSKEAYERVFLDHIGNNDKGAMLWPLRVALTGKKASPGPFEILAVMPKDTVLARITYAINLITAPRHT